MSYLESEDLDRLRGDAAELTSAALLVVDAAGCIVWCNGQMHRLLGYGPSELSSEPVSSIAPELRASDLLTRPELQQKPREQRTPRTVRFRCKDGSGVCAEIDVSMTGTAAAPFAVITIADPAARHKVTELVQQMARVNRLATAHLLSGSILHDFNNLLAGIAGHTSLARSALSRDDANLALDEALKATERCSQLIHRLRGSTKDEDTTLEGVVWQPVASEALSLLRGAVPQHMRVKLSLNGAPTTVNSTESEIHQVVVNLGLNAVDAMADTGGTLHVSFRTEWVEPTGRGPRQCIAAGEYGCLVVKDDGCGMDEETRNAAFEPFFSTKPAGVTRGLGLAIVKDIVTRRRGFVELDSEIGSGTELRVYLPIVTA
jgi:PAS domain S-box-containing protein